MTHTTSISAGCATVSAPRHPLNPPYGVRVSQSVIATSAANQIFERFASQSGAVYGLETCSLSADAHLSQGPKANFTSTAAFGIPVAIVLPAVLSLSLIFGLLLYRCCRSRNINNKKRSKSISRKGRSPSSSGSQELIYVDRKAELEGQRKHELEGVQTFSELDGDSRKHELSSLPNGHFARPSPIHVHELRGTDFCTELNDSRQEVH